MKNWISELWQYRELLWALTLREIKVRYKQTFFGAAWAILQPAALSAIFTLVFSNFLKIPSDGIAYPIFAYSALLPWTFFTTSISFASLSVVNNGNLVTKIYFPREILPLATIGAAFFDFLMASIIFLALAFIFNVNLSSHLIYMVIILPTIIIFITGTSLLLSCLNVIFRDIRFIVPLMLQVWLYITPVIYSLGQVPEKYKVFVLLNPMAPLVQGFRDITVLNKNPDILFLICSLLNSLIILVIGYWFFKSKERKFADII